MPTKHGDERRQQPSKTYESGPLSLHVYERAGKEFWRLARETTRGVVEIAVGHGDEIKAVKELFEFASEAGLTHKKEERSLWSRVYEPVSKLMNAATSFLAKPGEKIEQSQAIEKAWHAVVKLAELTDVGGIASVVRAFQDLEKGKRFCDQNPHVALCPRTFIEEPKKGTRIEISNIEMQALSDKGEGRAFKQQVDLLKWKADQGKYFELGYWHDKMEQPRIGQLVRFSSGLDDKGRPENRRVKPLGSLDPGKPDTPQIVLFEMTPRVPGVARIVELPANEIRALKAKNERNKERGINDDLLDSKRWNSIELGGRLRAIADREMKVPTIQREELVEKLSAATLHDKKFNIDTENLKIRTHIKGNFRADVIDQTGPDGKRSLQVVLSHQFTGQDGSQRTASAVFPFDELIPNDLSRGRATRNQEREPSPNFERERNGRGEDLRGPLNSPIASETEPAAVARPTSPRAREPRPEEIKNEQAQTSEDEEQSVGRDDHFEEHEQDDYYPEPYLADYSDYLEWREGEPYHSWDDETHKENLAKFREDALKSYEMQVKEYEEWEQMREHKNEMNKLQKDQNPEAARERRPPDHPDIQGVERGRHQAKTVDQPEKNPAPVNLPDQPPLLGNPPRGGLLGPDSSIGLAALPEVLIKPPVDNIRDNRYAIAGTWCGKVPAVMNWNAYYTQGIKHADERMVLPGWAKDLEPANLREIGTTYVVGIVTKPGLMKVCLVTDSLHMAINWANTIELEKRAFSQWTHLDRSSRKVPYESFKQSYIDRHHPELEKPRSPNVPGFVEKQRAVPIELPIFQAPPDQPRPRPVEQPL